MNKVVLATRKYKSGYEVREEASKTNFVAEPLTFDEWGEVDQETMDTVNYINEHLGDTVIVKSAYTPSGDYIGNKKMAHFLCLKRGIKPEKANLSHNVCSIGFCAREQKWYGWSHRAIFGFGIGDVVKEGDCTNSSGYIESYIKEHPEDDLSLPIGFTAITMEDCKRMAIAFAESVG